MFPAQEGHDQVPVFGVQVAGGFVCKDQTGVQDQSPGDGHPLFFAAGEGRDPLAQQGLQVQQAYQLVKILHRIAAVVDRGQQDILFAAQGGDQVVGLKDEADILQSEPGVIHIIANQRTIKVVFAAVIALYQSQNIQQCGLAGAGLSYNGHIAVIGDMQVHIRQHRAQIAFLQVFQFQIKLFHVSYL